MRKILAASIFILAFCALAFGQAANCPTITVTGPSTPVQPGDTAEFTASVSGIDLIKISYQWSVDKGRIIEGQGTPTVLVSTEGLEDSTVTATVEIKGLPDGCSNTDSETTMTYCPILAFRIDEFEISSKPIDPERLASFAREIKNNPNDTAYVIIYSTEKIPLREIGLKEVEIKNAFIREGLKTSSLVIISERSDGSGSDNRIVFWRVPQGAEPPTP